MEHEQAIQILAVERYLLREMSPAEREAFEEHYFECPVCANELRSASLFLEDAKRIWAAESRAALPPKAASSKSSGSIWSWFEWLQPQIAAPAMAAMLLAVGWSISRNTRLNGRLEEALTPRAVSYKVLLPVTRGQAPVLTAASGQPVVLQFYLPAPTSGQLQFVVKSTDNSDKLRMSGQAPAPEDPVTLSIPRFDLAPGAYSLVVESNPQSGKAGTEVARYALEVRRP